MDWRKLLADVNLIWTTMGLAVAGLSTAFGAGYWLGRRSLKGLRDTLKEYSDELADAHASSIVAPSARMNPAKSGKLVAIISASSTVTGSRAPRPSTRKLIAMR